MQDFSFFTLLAIAVVHATPLHRRGGQCDTGSLQCCNSVESADSAAAAKHLGSLDTPIQGLNVPVGISCTPLNFFGVGNGGTCTAAPACCDGNTYNGLVTLGCTPVNFNL